jgi:hypothetical protein
MIVSKKKLMRQRGNPHPDEQWREQVEAAVLQIERRLITRIHSLESRVSTLEKSSRKSRPPRTASPSISHTLRLKGAMR